jgi:gamma-glutamyltranspeptidase/glutathione hydrolase
LSDDEAQALAERREQLGKDAGARAIYLQTDGTSFAPGARLRNPDLAATLRLIQKNGAAGFYNGPVAEKIAAAMRANGGVMTTKDLADYRAHVLDPIWSDYRGYKIAYMPPTSAAVTVAEVINILERFPLGDYPWGGVQSMHLISEALKIGSVDRRYAGGGPQWQTPAHGLASKEFAAERAKLISMDHALDSKSLPAMDPGPYESAQTTQFTIVDGDGNVVSNTYTLSASFGAHVVAPGTGFLLNNSMSTFDWGGRYGKANAPEPDKRAQSTISPLIIFHDGKPWVATGTPGGGTIMSTMVHVIVNLIDYKLNIAEAIQRPRFSQGGPDEAMQLEESIPDDLIAGLIAKGHKVGRSQIIGSTQSIMIGPDGLLYGAADTRRPDAAAIGVTSY